jgi:hypothetical protein
MMYALLTLPVVFALVSRALAKEKGRDTAGAVWFGLFLGPFALIYYAAVPSLRPPIQSSGPRWTPGTWYCDVCHCANAMTEAVCCSCGQRSRPGQVITSTIDQKDG